MTNESMQLLLNWLDQLTPQDLEQWPEVLAEISELEQENPLLLDREFMANWITKFLVNALEQRGCIRQDHDAAIRQFVLQHPRPLVAGARLCLMLDRLSESELDLEAALANEVTPVRPQ